MKDQEIANKYVESIIRAAEIIIKDAQRAPQRYTLSQRAENIRALAQKLKESING
mgnify:CR=1 FL=1